MAIIPIPLQCNEHPSYVMRLINYCCAPTLNRGFLKKWKHRITFSGPVSLCLVPENLMIGLMNVQVLAISEGIAKVNKEISSGFLASDLIDTISYGICTQSRDVLSVVHLVSVLFVPFVPSKALHLAANTNHTKVKITYQASAERVDFHLIEQTAPLPAFR